MHYRTIPGSDLRLSTLSLGGWLTLGSSLAESESLRLLHTAIAAGVNFLDLADVYGNGAAERVVGKFLRETSRQQLVISSKVFWPTSDDPSDRGLSRRHIHASIDRTLDRLGTERIEIYFCHREDDSVPLAETVQAMGDLVKAGKIAMWGTSCWQPATLRAAHRLAAQLGADPPRVEQPPFNLLERNIEAAVIPCCERLAMAITVWSPLAGGVLTGKYLDGLPAGSRGATSRWLDDYLRPGAVAAVRGFVAVCREFGADPATVALAWVIAQPGITTAIAGASTAAQLEANLHAVNLVLPPALAAKLDTLFPPRRRSLFWRWLARLRT